MTPINSFAERDIEDVISHIDSMDDLQLYLSKGNKVTIELDSEGSLIKINGEAQ